MLSLSRTFDHDTSRTSSTSRSCCAQNPLSTAISNAAASQSGIKPMRSRWLIGWRSSEKIRGGDDRLCDLGNFFVLVHCCLAQQGVGVVLVEALCLHQNALGAIDDLALFKRGLRPIEFGLQPR